MNRLAFAFQVPQGYAWLFEQNLVGYEPHTQLQPWYYLDTRNVFDVTEYWPNGPFQDGALIAFARRQDCDDIACFQVTDAKTKAVVLVHGWTGNGYEIISVYENFWDWLKSVIDDIASLIEPDE